MMLRLLILITAFAATSICVIGQDLGSSNKLFGKEKKKPVPATTQKKAIRKPEPISRKTPAATAKKSVATPAKKATPVKNSKQSVKKVTTVAGKKADQRSTEFNVSRFSGKSAEPNKAPEQPKKVVEISTPKPKLPPGLTAAQADDLFEDLIDQGNRSRDERNYGAAESAYLRARPIKPSDSRAIYGLGNLFSDQLRWQEAERSYRAALELEPNNAVAHVALSYVLTQPVTVPNLSARYEEAEKLARRAIQLAPASAMAFDQLGAALELRGFISSETENAYRQAIRLDPEFAPPYAHLGRLLRRRGQKQESVVAYQNAINRSLDVGSKVLVAEVLQSEQRFEDSESLLRVAIADDPRNPTALLLLARALTTQGRYPEAETILRRVLTISDNGVMAHGMLATLYGRQGKTELAENVLLQAIRLVSDLDRRLLAHQFEAVGDAYMRAGKGREAERSYQRAVSLDSESEALSGKISRARQGRFGPGD